LKAGVSTIGDRLAITVKLMSAHTTGAQKLRAAVLQSFNDMWMSGIDADLMTNKVTQIPKADKASSNAAEFRSIAVSSGQSKYFSI
jgi:Zn-dependent M16 (insulinase) family peptidase